MEPGLGLSELLIELEYGHGLERGVHANEADCCLFARRCIKCRGKVHDLFNLSNRKPGRRVHRLVDPFASSLLRTQLATLHKLINLFAF